MTATPYLTASPDPAARLRVFCFREAGGSPAPFAKWIGAFGPEISILPVHLPGYGERSAEPSIDDRDTLLYDLDTHLGPLLDAPYAIYGQCMGGLLAHGFVRTRMRKGERMPECLILGASRAPHLSSEWYETALNWPDERVIQFFIEHGSVSPIILRHPELMTPLISQTRYYLKLLSSYTCPTDEPISSPIHVFAGSNDNFVPYEIVRHWRPHTTAEFSDHIVSGSHLFHTEMNPDFAGAMSKLLNTTAQQTRD
ncbi:thioesterase II family protein [Nocardia sp. XZ_19_385]|uniref:thioesterase II family protein n=1 Tax=Nocardia sp. XZ_19_385 TaxID=2769488 RepID=UPI00188E2965|nr:thioesterase [Nocardia sp. XZ_19_385]